MASTPEDRRCFVISPIGQHGSEVREQADAVLDYIIEPALRSLEIEAVRADRFAEPGLITEQMLAAILNFDLCIADLSGHNPNVFYELAIAQAAARPVVLLKRAGEAIPFDVKDYRLIEYDLKPKSIKEDRWVPLLKEQIRRVLEPSYRPPNLLRGKLASRADGIRSYLINARSEEFGDAPRYHEVVKKAESHCCLMGISLKVWASDDGRRVLEDLAARRVVVRVLIMDAENVALASMINAQLPAEDLESVKRHTVRMGAYFADLARRYPETILVRRMLRGMPHFQLIITERTALVLQYMFSRGTNDSPLQQFPSESQLHRAFLDEFENLWSLNDARD